MTHPNAAMLREIYADLSRIAHHCDDDVVLHAAERDLPGQVPKYRGVAAVTAKELDLIRRTQDTLRMDVSSITANDHFGAVTGLLRARLGDREIAMPFCGLWRFHHGRIIEHWENAYDASAFGAFLAGDMERAAPFLVPAAT